jgi:hypothetical protein
MFAKCSSLGKRIPGDFSVVDVERWTKLLREAGLTEPGN